MKDLGINLRKYVQALYNKNNNILLRQTTDDLKDN